MGYRIDYQPMKNVRNPEKRTAGIPGMTALFLLLFVFIVFSFWPQGAELLREILIPGEADVTVAALETFARELQCGESLSCAFDSFCRHILSEAQIALY